MCVRNARAAISYEVRKWPVKERRSISKQTERRWTGDAVSVLKKLGGRGAAARQRQREADGRRSNEAKQFLQCRSDRLSFRTRSSTLDKDAISASAADIIVPYSALAYATGYSAALFG